MKTAKNSGVILILVLASIIGKAQERESTPVTLEKVSMSVYQIKGGSGSNGGVIIGETLIFSQILRLPLFGNNRSWTFAKPGLRICHRTLKL